MGGRLGEEPSGVWREGRREGEGGEIKEGRSERKGEKEGGKEEEWEEGEGYKTLVQNFSYLEGNVRTG